MLLHILEILQSDLSAASILFCVHSNLISQRVGTLWQSIGIYMYMYMYMYMYVYVPLLFRVCLLDAYC